VEPLWEGFDEARARAEQHYASEETKRKVFEMLENVIDTVEKFIEWERGQPDSDKVIRDAERFIDEVKAIMIPLMWHR
jgi:hypothetical protein